MGALQDIVGAQRVSLLLQGVIGWACVSVFPCGLGVCLSSLMKKVAGALWDGLVLTSECRKAVSRPATVARLFTRSLCLSG